MIKKFSYIYLFAVLLLGTVYIQASQKKGLTSVADRLDSYFSTSYVDTGFWLMRLKIRSTRSFQKTTQDQMPLCTVFNIRSDASEKFLEYIKGPVHKTIKKDGSVSLQGYFTPTTATTLCADQDKNGVTSYYLANVSGGLDIDLDDKPGLFEGLLKKETNQQQESKEKKENKEDKNKQ